MIVRGKFVNPYRSTGSPLPVPGLRTVTNAVRGLNACWDGPGNVCMYFRTNEMAGPREWVIGIHDHDAPAGTYFEALPGDDGKIDAVAVARRLIANAVIP